MPLSRTDQLNTLPKHKAEFIEPMECLPVSRLNDGREWVYEILCGAPHKIIGPQMQ